MIKCDLVIDKDINQLYNLFLPENNQAETPRAKYDIKIKKNNLKITLKAKDITSLKAFMNTIIKFIETYYKIKDLKKI